MPAGQPDDAMEAAVPLPAATFAAPGVDAFVS